MSTHIINHVLNRLITSGDQKINMYATFVLVSVVLTGACCTTQIQLKFYLFKKRKRVWKNVKWRSSLFGKYVLNLYERNMYKRNIKGVKHQWSLLNVVDKIK
jgi:hypothetical protein